MNIVSRLGQILEKMIPKLGWEFWYSFHENLHSYRFFCVESDFLGYHREKCTNFLLSRRFQNGRPLTRYLEIWSPWGYVIKPNLLKTHFIILDLCIRNLFSHCNVKYYLFESINGRPLHRNSKIGIILLFLLQSTCK